MSKKFAASTLLDLFKCDDFYNFYSINKDEFINSFAQSLNITREELGLKLMGEQIDFRDISPVLRKYGLCLDLTHKGDGEIIVKILP